MSRRSLESLRTATVERMERLSPPSHLSDEEKSEWIAMVNSMPADYFIRGNQALLEQYCHHVCAARLLAAEIAEVRLLPLGTVISAEDRGSDQDDAVDPRAQRPIIRERYLLTLLSKQTAETQAINLMLRSMRLTQQAIYNARTAATKHKHASAPTLKPWEDAA